MLFMSCGQRNNVARHYEIMSYNDEGRSSIGPYGFEDSTYVLTRVLRHNLSVDESWSGAAVVRVCVQTDRTSGCCSYVLEVVL